MKLICKLLSVLLCGFLLAGCAPKSESRTFFAMDTVDYQTDMHDPDSHLNPSGARKITDYMGRLLSQQYKIPDQRNNPEYQSWYEDAEQYRQEKIDLFFA